MSDDMKNKPDSYWKEKLTPEQYKVLRQKGTEIPFTGKYVNNKEPGVYVCAACGQVLFSSDHKYETFSGWPSFYDLVNEGSITLEQDFSHGLDRIEVKCANCGSHLGHFFEDYSNPTGKYYCINSCALDFKSDNDSQK